jgi:hypothetical protein
VKLEIKDIGDADARKRWWHLCDRSKQIVNRIWRLWESHHTINGTDCKLREFLDAHAKWKKEKGKKDTKPKAPDIFPKELGNAIYHNLFAAFPDVASHVLVLLLNSTRGKIINCKAAKGSLPGHSAILLDHQGRPSSTRPIPVPFSKQNSSLSVDVDGIVTLMLRIHRNAIEGKKSGVNTVETMRLITDGKAARYAKPIIDLLNSGGTICGSSIVFDDRRRKWFAHLAYNEAAEPLPQHVAQDRIMRIRPGYARPWQCRVDGRRQFVGGKGTSLEYKRKQIMGNRFSRWENYRYTASATKGHGRDRALDGVGKLRMAWNSTTKTYNQQTVAEIVDRAIKMGCGTIEVHSPATNRFLERCGKGSRFENSGWPWFSFQSILKNTASRKGLSVIIHAAKRAEVVVG